MKEVISASRRTDIPAFYLDWLICAIGQGYAEVPHPHSGKVNIVDLRPEHVHTLVLWSKNFQHFLRCDRLFKDYHLYFLFTINDIPDLEPGIPSLTERLNQASELSSRYSPEHIGWRYDPVIFTENSHLTTIETFEKIGETLSTCGITRVIFSFLDFYPKVTARLRRVYQHRTSPINSPIIDPSDEEKIDYARRLARSASRMRFTLESCSEELVPIEGITPSSCINGVLLSYLRGEPAKLSKDTGQRPECRCTVSRDIGSYRTMPCSHGCLYCYANHEVSTSDLSSLNKA